MNFPNPKTAVAIEELFDELRVDVYKNATNDKSQSPHELYALLKEQHERLWQAIKDKNESEIKTASLKIASLSLTMHLR